MQCSLSESHFSKFNKCFDFDRLKLMNIFLNYGKQFQFTIVFNVLREMMQHTSNVRYCLN